MASTSNCAECCVHAANPFHVQEIALTKKQQQKKDGSIFGELFTWFFNIYNMIRWNETVRKREPYRSLNNRNNSNGPGFSSCSWFCQNSSQTNLLRTHPPTHIIGKKFTELPWNSTKQTINFQKRPPSRGSIYLSRNQCTYVTSKQRWLNLCMYVCKSVN